MKQELLLASIEQLEQEILILRKEKVSLYEETHIIRNEIDFSNKNYLDSKKQNWLLLAENKRLSSEISAQEDKIALLSFKELEMTEFNRNIEENLNKSIVRRDNLSSGITHLKNEKVALEKMVFLLQEQKTQKRWDLWEVDNNITKQKEILEEINSKIKDFENQKRELEEKDARLKTKDSQLKKKEERLLEFKKEILSNK